MNRPGTQHLAALGAVAAALALSIAGCAREQLEGPPQLRLGRDECAECGMSIVEERCSSALLADVRGRREHLVFDDIGCMLDLERDASRFDRVVARFVHDYASKTWTEAESAWFVVAPADRLATPMGTGIVAFEQRDEANLAAQEHQGQVLSWISLVQHGGATVP